MRESQRVEEIKKIIHFLDMDEIRSVQDELIMRRNYLAKRTMVSVKVGDKVKFFHKKCGTVHGTVTKVNRTTVSVSENGSMGIWRVPATLLEMV